MTLDEVQKVKWTLEQLKPISRKLNALGVRACNGVSESQETRDATSEAKLTKRADLLAQDLGLRFYHQTDPRGCSVYLIDENMDDSTYSRGIAI